MPPHNPPAALQPTEADREAAREWVGSPGSGEDYDRWIDQLAELVATGRAVERERAAGVADEHARQVRIDKKDDPDSWVLRGSLAASESIAERIRKGTS